MGYTNRIETVDMSGLSDFERIDQNLRSLLVAIEATLPGSRGFGMPVEINDLTPEEARNSFSAALDEKVEEYIPEIRIANVEFDMEGGQMTVRIYVEGNPDYEEGEVE